MREKRKKSPEMDIHDVLIHQMQAAGKRAEFEVFEIQFLSDVSAGRRVRGEAIDSPSLALIHQSITFPFVG